MQESSGNNRSWRSSWVNCGGVVSGVSCSTFRVIAAEISWFNLIFTLPFLSPIRILDSFHFDVLLPSFRKISYHTQCGVFPSIEPPISLPTSRRNRGCRQSTEALSRLSDYTYLRWQLICIWMIVERHLNNCSSTPWSRSSSGKITWS